MASVILSIAVLGVSGTVAASYQETNAMRETATAISLARQLLEEIASKPLANPANGSTAPGRTSGHTTRAQFDHVGDYAGYADVSTALATISGSTINETASATYSRAVTVVAGATPSIDTASPTTDFDLVTVTVTAPSGRQESLRTVVSNYTFTR